MRVLFILLISSSLSVGCYHNKTSPDNPAENTGNAIKYARGFEIQEADGLVSLRVKNPWQQAENVTYEYWLGKDTLPEDKSIPVHRYFKVPVEKVGCLSTTFFG